MRNHRQNKGRSANRRLAKKRVQCLNEALCFVSSSVLADSLVLRNPLLRQAPKRCTIYYDNETQITRRVYNDEKNFSSTLNFVL